MNNNLSFDLNQFYAEIKEKAEAEGIADKEAYDSMVEDYVNDKISAGELDKDDDYEGMIEDLKGMWPEYEKNLNIH